MSQPIRTLSVTLHPYAECLDCDWKHSEHKEARGKAKSHVKVSGHTVHVVRRTVDVYELR